MRYVIDTNIIISALITPTGKPRKTLDQALKHGVLLFSFATRSELLIKLRNDKKFSRIASLEERMAFCKNLFTLGFNIEPKQTINICRDRRDNIFLEIAVDGSADYIISGDNDLLVLHPFQGVQIVNPATFLEISLS